MAVEAELTAVLRNPMHVRSELAKRARAEVSVYADTYYDRPDRGMDRDGYELRVRTITTNERRRTLLTYKQPAIDDSGSKPEYETTVADAEVMRVIFAGLGLVEMVAFEKHCENYRFVERGRELLATVVQIPELDGKTFLELETLVEAGEVPAALAVLRDVLNGLGVEEADLSTQSYTDRVAAHRAG